MEALATVPETYACRTHPSHPWGNRYACSEEAYRCPGRKKTCVAQWTVIRHRVANREDGYDEIVPGCRHTYTVKPVKGASFKATKVEIAEGSTVAYSSQTPEWKPSHFTPYAYKVFTLGGVIKRLRAEDRKRV